MTHRNAAYLDFVRGHVSCLSWEDQNDPLECFVTRSHAHHVRMGGGGGMGIKPSDFRCVPLTDYEHRRLHQMGEKSFWRDVGVDPARVMIALLLQWLGRTPPLDLEANAAEYLPLLINRADRRGKRAKVHA